MIRRLFLYESASLDPYRNLAIEEALLHRAEDCAILYLWQNASTVVIGRNQNPWKECDTSLLRQEGGRLARRLSGGGAVYHDLGNLNFTILLPQEAYDVTRQLSVVCQAVQSLGIPAQCSGRNDLLVEGQKFSGSAFYKNGRTACHHGTLLLHGDLNKLSRYLTPSPLKLRSKGVDSVRSRVANLCQWNRELTVCQMKQALKDAFSRVYGLPLEPLEALDEAEVSRLTRRNAGWDWNYGPRIPFSCMLEARFFWGGVEIGLNVDRGRITEAKVWTDAMETRWAVPLEQSLTGCAFEKEKLLRRLVPTLTAEEAAALLAGL